MGILQGGLIRDRPNQAGASDDRSASRRCSSFEVLTARVAGWVDESDLRLAWIVEGPVRHNIGDWGELDEHDHEANARSVHHRRGLLSRYPVPTELLAGSEDDDAIWIITDDLEDADTTTTVLWPGDC